MEVQSNQRSVTLKYGKESHVVVLEDDDTLETLQGKIYWATTVLPKNMKILNKGSKVVDDKSVKELKDGVVLTIMGTKETNILNKIEIAVDPEKDKPKPKRDERFGLVNVGNTCYLNSCLQLLRGARELDQWLRSNPVPPDNYGFKGLVSDISDLMRWLSKDTVKPVKFVTNFLSMAPEFGPLGEQQDADECWQKLTGFLHKIITVRDEKLNKEVNLIDRLFEIEYFDTVGCPDLPDEKPTENISSTRRLSCIIGGNPDVKINTLTEGITAYLNDTVTKKSPTDGKDHIYKRVSKLNNLPPYLIVQQVRFFWKEANELGGTKATGTKITRAIDFPAVLDIYEFTTPQLKQNLRKGREVAENFRKKADANQEEEFNKYLEAQSGERFKDRKTAFRDFKEEMAAIEAKRFDEDVYRPINSGHATGQYNLVGVVTHLGQSVYSGHYLSWVHKTGKEWNKFDDDTVYEKKLEDVLALRGGLANTEMGYVLMYRRREVPYEQ